MANIRQIKSGNWNVQVRIAGKPARSQTFHSRESAEIWAKNIESTLNFRHPEILEAGMMYCEQVLAGKASREQTEFRFNRLAALHAGFESCGAASLKRSFVVCAAI